MFFFFFFALSFGQTETIDLSDNANKVDRGQKLFRRNRDAKSLHSMIDSDGLPYVGQVSHMFSTFFFLSV